MSIIRLQTDAEYARLSTALALIKIMFGYRKSFKWKTYEEVAQFLLNQFASELRLGRVEGKQVVPGQTGTSWEIDAKEEK